MGAQPVLTPEDRDFWMPRSRTPGGKNPPIGAKLWNLKDEARALVAEWLSVPQVLGADGGSVPGTGPVATAQRWLAHYAALHDLPWLVCKTPRRLNAFYTSYGLWLRNQEARNIERQKLEETGDPEIAELAGVNYLLNEGLVARDAKLIVFGARLNTSKDRFEHDLVVFFRRRALARSVSRAVVDAQLLLGGPDPLAVVGGHVVLVLLIVRVVDL